MAVAARNLLVCTVTTTLRSVGFLKQQNTILLPGLADLRVSGTVLIKLAPHFIMELMDKMCHGDQLSLIYARGFFLKKLQRLLLLPIVFKHKGLFFGLLACSE